MHSTGDDRLGTFTDRAEITDLVNRYVITLDTHDELGCDDEWYRTIFTEDVKLEFPIGGYDGVPGLAGFQTAARAKWDRTHHVGTNCVVNLDGDHATVRAQVLGTHVHLRDQGTEPLPHFTVGGYYDAEAVRTTGGWRFRRLALHVVWTTGPGLAPQPSTVDLVPERITS
jgi:hypothetical protein